jgi:hypothetical protein
MDIGRQFLSRKRRRKAVALLAYIKIMKKILLPIIAILLTIPVIAMAATVTQPVQGGTGTACKPTYGQLLLSLGGGVYTCIATSTIGLPTGTGASTYVTVWNGPSSITGSSDFTWDSVADTLTIIAASEFGTTPIMSLAVDGGGGSVFQVLQDGTVKMNASGNAAGTGVGTSTPSARFAVKGAFSGIYSDRLAAFSNNDDREEFTVLSNGSAYARLNIGAGTTSPAFALSAVANTGTYAGVVENNSAIGKGLLVAITEDNKVTNAFEVRDTNKARTIFTVGPTLDADFPAVTSYANLIFGTDALYTIGNATNRPITAFFSSLNNAGSIVYTDANGQLLDDPNIFKWDENNNRLGLGTTTPGTSISIGNTGANTINLSETATSTFGSGINIRTGCFAINGTCLSVGAAAAGGGLGWASTTSPNSDSIFSTALRNVGIGTTSPYAKLSVVGEVVARNFTATSTTATSTFPNATVTYLETGPAFFETNAGQVNLVDMPVTSASANNTVHSIATQIDSTTILNVSARSDGAGSIKDTAVSIGTSTVAKGYMSITGNTSSTTAPLITVASSTGSNLFTVNNNGHIVTGGTAPTVSTCGTSPSVSGNDTAGTVTVGSGVVTACTLTFYKVRASTPQVVGVTTGGGLNIAGGYSAKSTSAVTFSFAATVGSGTFDYLIIE